MSFIYNRVLVFAAGLAGAAGVALSAVAAHKGGPNLETAARMLLIHAPALLCLSLFASRLSRIAAILLMLGVVLFSGDLILRDFTGHKLFDYAAPIGGSLMIIGWLVVAISALRRG